MTDNAPTTTARRDSSERRGAMAGRRRGGPCIIAHRAGAALWPENSLAGVRGSQALSVDGIEIDVHLTADGDLAVIHDSDLARTTRGSGAVASLTMAEIRRAPLRQAAGSQAADACVPSLADVLAVMADGASDLWLEMKGPTEGTAYPGMAHRVCAALAAADFVGRTVVMSFDWDQLVDVRSLQPGQPGQPGLRTAALLDTGGQQRAGGVTPAVGRAKDTGATWLAVAQGCATPVLLRAAAAADLAVAVWTVNDEPALKRWLHSPVGAVISDQPDRALALGRPARPWR
ncbi:MAG: glycerophosphodiester phosphodiesterase family protein [Alphaproteobacteria bacterium]